ncbi:MAG: MBOAT family protein, partial [Verrucomicrobia bacterium]|nr:MBOAT family protein [Verrucomicrobiota bacterium]
MLFNSYVFIFAFLPLIWAGFIVLGRCGHRRAAIGWVVLMSFAFYGWWNPKYLWLVSGSMAFNYLVGVHLGRNARTPRGKAFLTLGVAANLILLGYYKYTDFLIANLDALGGFALPLQHVILPLGISFFTFTQIAYLVDAYRGETHEYNPLDYALFVLFFPHLIAGPIIHHKDVIPQFGHKDLFRFNPEIISVGFSLFIIGLFKKTVLADGIAKYSSPVFDLAKTGGDLGAWTAWGGVVAYALQ